MRRTIVTAAAFAFFAACLSARPAQAARCGTGRLGRESVRPAHAALSRRSLPRDVVPVQNQGHVLPTEHFRVIWGDGYDPADPQWADPDGDGVPLWVAELSQALETAYTEEIALGFPAPYGVDRYYLDAYVGNTGARWYDARSGTWIDYEIGQGLYAYTMIDVDHAVAYFVFGADFSAFTDDEVGVLRATAAHELFHAIQRTDYPWDDEVAIPAARWDREGWWTEATATWMEEVCQPDVDDYLSYVPAFMAHPEAALASVDGLREYGAAIFPGLLWLRYGGAALWQDIFREAFPLGLEASMEQALAAEGGPSLPDVVTSFWSLAAHPQDAWPDGARFGSPPLLASGDQLPLDIAPGPDAPDRFGANLVRVDGTLGALYGELSQAAAGTRLAFGVSAAGGAKPEVFHPVAGAAPAELWAGGGSPVYVALVNGSDEAGPSPYLARVSPDTGATADPTAGGGGPGTDPSTDGAPAGADPAADGGAAGSGQPTVDGGDGGGGGGCFLTALGGG